MRRPAPKFACVLMALTVVVMVLSAPPARSADQGRRVALVVGNSAYKNVTPLANPANDARLMAEALKSLGFELVGGRALTDVDSKGEMEQAVQHFGEMVRGAAVGVFFYAGHGVQVDGRNYLVPVGANVAGKSQIKYQLLDADFVLDEMGAAGTQVNVVILDACRNNPFGDRGLRDAGAGLAQIMAPKGTLVAYSTAPGRTASDGTGKNSPFTEALARNIRTQGLRIDDVFMRVGVDVEQQTHGEQSPWKSDNLRGVFCLSGKCAQASGGAEADLLQTRISALQKELEAKSAQAEQAKAQTDRVAALQKELAEKSAQAEALQKAQATGQAATEAAVQARIGALQKELAEKNALAEQAKVQAAKVALLQKELDDKTAQAQGKGKAMDAATQARINALQKELAEKSAQADQAREQAAKVAVLQKELAEKNAQADALQKAQSTGQAAVEAAVQARIGALQKELSEKNAATELALTQIAKVAALQKELAERSAQAEATQRAPVVNSTAPQIMFQRPDPQITLANDPSWRIGATRARNQAARFDVSLDTQEKTEDSEKSFRLDYDFPQGTVEVVAAIMTRKKRDLSEFKGIEFAVKATQNVPCLLNLTTSHPSNPRMADRFYANFQASPQWQMVRIPFDTLAPSSRWANGAAVRQGYTPGDQVLRVERVEDIRIGVDSERVPPSKGSLWVDVIHFYK